MTRLGFDIDGVLADFTSAYCRALVHLTGVNRFPWDPAEPSPDVPCWDFETHYGYNNHEVARTWEWIQEHPTFWSGLGEAPGCADLRPLMPALLLGHEVYFVTARVGHHVKWQTENWLIQHLDLDYPPTVLISREKGLVARALSLDAYIDDRLENGLSVCEEAPRTRTYLLDRPYNQSPDSAPYRRVATLSQMLTAEGLP